ncbi:hypothetical protein SAMN05661099_1530 [Daejeonella lutea]|uniref:Uncharacterized protein n=1 Tax=Daejeonella lutea TaxID=572036 RepID=A0A1T5BE71_9SPHI|nr:hypothetical protein SAMN05661099_1530 [Daejeonella lutea]
MGIRSNLILVVTIILVWLAPPVFAQIPFPLDSLRKEHIFHNAEIEFLEDTSSSLSFAEILKRNGDFILNQRICKRQ